ncbi:hypothetical protein RUMHYD_01205 [Blautia hydrogenotrophica DSM 10507]|uniref:Uncharacterized protein n=1 Tax=Blautia hydrogenotrophica (strain DSM 10507 / JCM 14656 / S5a33) TaxID=476272 RepID=C0CK35_BLAHS|nr:hypothetical protein RUMHYD_01205 [Blautia hydrogenotrophica DSM 10507]
MRRSENTCQDCGRAMHGAIRSLYFLEVPPTGGLRVCMISGYLIVIGKMGLRQTAV